MSAPTEPGGRTTPRGAPELTPAGRIALGGSFLALSIALPMLFHLLGAGAAFLPMLLPVLVLGFIADPRVVITVGVLAPLTSSLLTGMPPLVPPIALAMAVELPCLGVVAWLTYRRLRWRLFPALLTAVVVGRLAAAVLRIPIALWLDLPPLVYVGAGLLRGLPGVALQLVVVPLVVRAVEQRRHPL